MDSNPEKMLANIARADTDDLIDRITAYRAGMEPDAIDLIEEELQRRGITPESIANQRRQYERECLFDADGTAKMCSLCRKPAVAEGWGWHKLMGKVPLFPRPMRFCKEHQPATSAAARPHPPA